MLHLNLQINYYQEKLHTLCYENSEIRKVKKKFKNPSQRIGISTCIGLSQIQTLVCITETPQQFPRDGRAASTQRAAGMGAGDAAGDHPCENTFLGGWESEKAPAMAKLRYKHSFINYSKSLQLSILLCLMV